MRFHCAFCGEKQMEISVQQMLAHDLKIETEGGRRILKNKAGEPIAVPCCMDHLLKPRLLNPKTGRYARIKPGTNELEDIADAPKGLLPRLID